MNRVAALVTRSAIVIVLTLIAVVAVYPIVFMALGSFKTSLEYITNPLGWPASFGYVDNYLAMYYRFDIRRLVGNTVTYIVLAAAISLAVSIPASYAFAKLRFPGRKVLFVLIVSTLMVPIQVLMVPQFQIIADLGWLNSIWGVVIPRAAEAFGIFFARQYFASIPNEVIEAARIDGASELTILRRVVLPVSKPLIAVLVIFTFMWRWNEFAWPLIVLKDTQSYTAPIGLLFLQGQNTIDYSALMAMALLSVLPIILVFLFFQRYFVEGVVRSGLK